MRVTVHVDEAALRNQHAVAAATLAALPDATGLAGVVAFLDQLLDQLPEPAPEPPAGVGGPRVLARFQPQAWINDYAVDIDGVVKFDVTDQVDAMGRDAALAIEDYTEAADRLWHQSHAGSASAHAGPFAIVVEAAVRDYFDRLDRGR